jgi:hypothetical protein
MDDPLWILRQSQLQMQMQIVREVLALEQL